MTRKKQAKKAPPQAAGLTWLNWCPACGESGRRILSGCWFRPAGQKGCYRWACEQCARHLVTPPLLTEGYYAVAKGQGSVR